MIKTHWPLSDAEVILQVNFSNLFYELIAWEIGLHGVPQHL